MKENTEVWSFRLLLYTSLLGGGYRKNQMSGVNRRTRDVRKRDKTSHNQAFTNFTSDHAEVILLAKVLGWWAKLYLGGHVCTQLKSALPLGAVQCCHFSENRLSRTPVQRALDLVEAATLCLNSQSCEEGLVGCLRLLQIWGQSPVCKTDHREGTGEGKSKFAGGVGKINRRIVE